ncbi:MAG: hypothetical protein AB7K52_11290 [Phycisphaerales bacterium]
MSARLSRNNVKAGVFVAAGIAGLLIVLMTIGNVWDYFTQSRTTYVFRFSIDDGALGLKKGSIVKIGGKPVGEVVKVTFKKPDDAKSVDPLETQSFRVQYPINGDAPAPEPREAIYVIVSIDTKEVPVYRNAKVFLELPLLGNVSTINIPDVGGGRYNARSAPGQPVQQIDIGRLQPWEMIPATLAPPTFLGQAGYGPDQKDQLQIILQRGSEIAEQVKEMVSSTQGQLDSTMRSVEDAAKNLSSATGMVNGRLPNWLDQIGTILVSANGAAEEGRQRLIEAKALLVVVQNALDENRANIDRIFSGAARTAENTAAITDKVNNELYAIVRDALIDGRKVLATTSEAVDRVDRLLAEKTPEFGRIIANARLASDQLKLTMTEVRRNPWRLLYQPTRREIEEELTYDAARTYAEAVSQLRAGTEALEAAVGGMPGDTAAVSEQERERLRLITQEIQASFAKYRDAEQKFLERLTREP